MTDATPYTVPQEPGRWRAIILAALVHLALLAFLWIGVRWQNETPTTIEAEVWSPQPREAAPQPEPVVEKEPEPAPVIRETPREMPKPQVDEPPVVKPDIALEQEKKRKELEKKKKRLEEEQLARQKKLEQEKLALQKKEREEREAKLKKEEELAKKKAEQERLAKQEAEKKEKEKKAADAKRKQEAEEKMLAKLRNEELKRLAGGVTGTGGSGEAAKSQGGRADSGYAGRVAAKIKSNIVFNAPESLADNPPVEYEVNLLPDGSIAGMKKLKSSGVPGFDEAVRRAIEKSQPYPKDKSGSVPSSFIGIHRPKDQ
ncbi:MAG: cell envelope integrity protein TolA [Bacillota bacterium]